MDLEEEGGDEGGDGGRGVQGSDYEERYYRELTTHDELTSARNNTTTGGGAYNLGGPTKYPTWAASLIVLACGVIIAGTILGNLLVCTAVSIVRKLRTNCSNWLIVSLAVADLLVALIVMPLATMYEVI